MTKTTIARLAGLSTGVAMIAGVFAPASAQTIAQLQAQIAALMAQLNALSGSTSAAITSDLTVGSTGAQVVTLQNALVSGGYLVMPAGVAPGYFGSLTRAAVMKWQAANGISATGFFGPLSRAKFGGVATTPGTPVAPGAITTPGVEGTLTVTNAPVSNSTVYEGQTMRDVLAFKVEADLSDMAIQRIKLDLENDSTFYRDIASMVYLVDDAGKVLASAALNNNTVVRNSSNVYEITLAGFSSVVAKDTSRVYTVKADIQDSIDTADMNESPFVVSLAANGVRAIDGAGIDSYSPANNTTVTKSMTVSASLADSASLAVSANVANPLAKDVVAAGGSNENEADKVVLLVFDIRAEKDDVEITDLLNFDITSTGGTGATASTSYLYVGNGTSGQLLGNDALSGSETDFENISYTIPAGSTRTFTLAADIRNANTVATTFAASFTGNTTNVVAENTAEDTVSTVTGSATGNSVVVRNIGATFALQGLAAMTRQTVSSNDTSGVATSTGIANFTVRVTAVGGDIVVGSVASSTTLLGTTNSATTTTTWLSVYKNGAANGALSANTAAGTSAVLSYSQPSNVTVSGQNWTITEGNYADIPVTAQITVAANSTNTYSVQINGFRWFNSTTGYQNTTSMADKAEWRTNAISLP